MRFTQRPLPRYAFLPGKSPHPIKSPDGHMYNSEEPELDRIDPDNWQNNEDYLYSLDLLNLGYFWESHVWLEALWNSHERKGEIAELLKGLIKIGAAGIKARQGSLAAADGHLKRAQELFDEAFKKNKNEELLGLSKQKLEEFIAGTRDELEDFIADNHRQRRCFRPLLPKI